MKHIFFVHSNLTYLGALSVINQLNINSKDIILSTNYSFKLPNSEIPTINLSNLLEKNTERKSWKERLFNSRCNYLKFDDLLNNLVDQQKFAIYLPHIGHKEYRIIANHPNCLEVNFIEDGIGSYIPTLKKHKGLYGGQLFFEQKKQDLIRALYKRKIVHSFMPKHLYETAPIKKKEAPKFFGFTDKSFQHLKDIHKIKLEQVKNLQVALLKPNSDIIVLDALAEVGLVSYDTMISSVEKIAVGLKEKQFSIKFHHFQDQKLIDEILYRFNNNNLSYDIIEYSVLLEDQFLNKAHGRLTIHGFITSLLYYAKVAGHQVFSYENLLLDDDKYRQHIKERGGSPIEKLLTDD